MSYFNSFVVPVGSISVPKLIVLFPGVKARGYWGITISRTGFEITRWSDDFWYNAWIKTY
jgi:hypothetical protein